MVLHKSISIVLQLTNQINKKFSREIMRCQGYFLKLLWGWGFPTIIHKIFETNSSFHVK